MNQVDTSTIATTNHESSGSPAVSTEPLHAKTAAVTTSRAQRRQEARKAKKKSYSKNLGARLNYERTLNTHQKNNTAWDDVVEIRNATSVVLNAPTALLPYFRSKEIESHIIDRDYLTRCSLAMVEEVRGLYERFSKNANRHANKSGRAATMDDTFTAYEIYNEYLTILDVYDTGAGRMFEVVVEQLQLAVGAYVEAVGAENATDIVTKINNDVKALMVGQQVARNHVAKSAN